MHPKSRSLPLPMSLRRKSRGQSGSKLPCMPIILLHRTFAKLSTKARSVNQLALAKLEPISGMLLLRTISLAGSILEVAVSTSRKVCSSGKS